MIAGETKHEHWADLVAKKLKERGGSHVIETGTSISGIPHIGNASDVMRGDAVRKALADLKVSAKLIWVADDSDPFRKTPAGMEQLKKHLGKPVYDVPDPEGECHENFVKHFALPFIDELEAFGVVPEIHYGTELYRKGELIDEIRIALEKRIEIIEILNKFRKDPLPSEFIPWNPVCEGCEKISTARATEVEADIVEYVCEDKDFSGSVVKGCGHTGKSDITNGEGKLPWRVEWAARWKHFKVTCEPFGKDHAAAGGSYDTSKLISKQIFNWDAPEPVVYGFLTINGAKISSSSGNVITLADWNQIAEPAVLRYLMFKRLEKQRDVDLSKIPNMTDEYDDAEKASIEGGDAKLKRMYELSTIPGIKNEPLYCGVPYSLCAVLSQFLASYDKKHPFDVAQEKVEAMGYKPDNSRLRERVVKARHWIEGGYCPDYLKFDLQDGNKFSTLSADQQKFLAAIPSELDDKWTPETFHKRIYEISREIGLKPAEAFKAIYLVLIGKEKGPKAASFILSLEKEFISERFGK